MRLFKPKLVRFEDGKYGVRTNFSIIGWKFASIFGDYSFSFPEHVDKHCKTNDLETAKNVFERVSTINKPRNRYKLILDYNLDIYK
jgi:hypothetical protein